MVLDTTKQTHKIVVAIRRVCPEAVGDGRAYTSTSLSLYIYIYIYIYVYIQINNNTYMYIALSGPPEAGRVRRRAEPVQIREPSETKGVMHPVTVRRYAFTSSWSRSNTKTTRTLKQTNLREALDARRDTLRSRSARKDFSRLRPNT